MAAKSSSYKNITLKQFSQLTPLDISRLTKQQAKEIIQKMRPRAERKEASFARNNTIYSPAIEQYQQKKVKINTKTKRNDLLKEVRNLQKLTSSKTFTVKGAKAVQEEQSKRLFGTDLFGKPMGRLTKEEAKKFWKTYNELINQHPALVSFIPYMKIQQYIAQSGAYRKFSANTLDEIYETLMNQRNEEDEFVPNVFSGSGDDYM